MTSEQLENEKVLLCCSMINSKYTGEILHSVKSDLFLNPIHKTIFEKTKSVYIQDGVIDSEIVKRAFNNQYNNIIDDVANQTGINSNWKFFFKKQKDYYLQDVLLNSLRDKDIKADNARNAMLEIIETFSSAIMSNTECKSTTINILCMNVLNELQESYNNKAKPRTVTQFNAIDNIIKKIDREYILLGARPSIGKSALAVSIAMNLAKQGIKTAYFSLEMRGEQIGIRRLAEISNIPINILQNGTFTEKDLAKINNGLSEMSKHPFSVIDNMTNPTLSNILTEIRRAYMIDGTKAFFIDHVSLVKSDNQKKPRHEQYIEISNALQRIQRELNIVLVVIIQVGRGTEGKRPTLADFKESSAFEQDCDIAMLLHRERATEQDETQIKAELIIAKNRNGATGTGKLMFIPRYSKFRDVTSEELAEWN